MAGASGLVLSFLAGVMVGRGVEGSADGRRRDAPRHRGARGGRATARAQPGDARHPGRFQLPGALQSDKPEEGLERSRAASPASTPVPTPTPTARPASAAPPLVPMPRPAVPRRRPPRQPTAPATAPAAAAQAQVQAPAPATTRPASPTGPLPKAQPETAGWLRDPGGAFKDPGEAPNTVANSLKTRGFPCVHGGARAARGDSFTVRVGLNRGDRADAETVESRLYDDKFKPYIIKQSADRLCLSRAEGADSSAEAPPCDAALGRKSSPLGPVDARRCGCRCARGRSTPSARRLAARTSASASAAARPPSCCSVTAARAAAATAQGRRSLVLPDPEEPGARARAAARGWGCATRCSRRSTATILLTVALCTSRTIVAVRAALPRAGIEVSTPDFKGDPRRAASVLVAEPTVFNHNIETVLCCSGTCVAGTLRLEPRGARGRARPPAAPTKSGAHARAWARRTKRCSAACSGTWRASGVEILTLGQYLRPTGARAGPPLPPARGRSPGWSRRRARIGFPTVYAGVFVRRRTTPSRCSTRGAC